MMRTTLARTPKQLVLCLLPLMGTPALADDIPSDTPVVKLPPITITVERQVKQSLGVSHINQTDLQKTPVSHDIAEIVRKMPGVNLIGNSATGQRGNQRQIDIRGMGPENTLILVDGRPISSRNAVRYGWRGERDTRGDLQWIPSEAIVKIEVLRGPAAARYGSGAMGGVVNIITKKVSDDYQGSAQVYAKKPQNNKEGGSYRVGASASGALLPDVLGFRVYGNFNKTQMDDPDINPLVPLINSDGSSYLVRAAGREGVSNKDVGLRLAWQINPEHSLSFDVMYGWQGNQYTGDTQHSNRDATASDAKSRNKASNELLKSLIGQQTNKMTRQSHAITHDGLYAWGESRVIAQYDKTKNTRLNEGLAGGPEGVIIDGNLESTQLDTWRLHAQTHIPFNFGNIPQTLTLGAEYAKDQLKDAANTDEGTDARLAYAHLYVRGDRSKMTSQIISAYAENHLTLGERANLALAARYDYHNQSGSNLSPSLNLSYDFGQGLSAKAGIARAYKAPNLYQNSEGYLLGTRGNGCPTHIQRQACVLQGNRHLKPETSINTEFGLQYRNNTINASATYFRNDYKNKIVAGWTAAQTNTLGKNTLNLLKWENTPNALTEGIEGSFAWQKGNTRWTNNLTYMLKSIDKRTNNPLSIVPTYTLNSNLNQQINDDWDINLSYTHYGKQKPRKYAENNIENAAGDGLLHTQAVKSYGIMSVNTGYRFNKALSGRIGIDNIFNQQKLRDNTQSQTYNETGRAYFASLHYQF